MTEVAAALIWSKDRFLIFRRPAHKALRWIRAEEIPQYDVCPADAVVLKRLRGPIFRRSAKNDQQRGFKKIFRL